MFGWENAGKHRFIAYYHHVINNLRNRSESPPLAAMLLSEQNTMSVYPINQADRHNRQHQMPSIPVLL